MITSMKSAASRIAKRDIAIALAFSALGMALMISNVQDEEIEASVLAVPLFLLITVPVLWRRVAPLAVVAVTLGALLVHAALFGSLVRCGTLFPLVFVLAFTTGSLLERREALLGLGASLATVAVICLTDAVEDLLGALPFVGALTAASWGVGRLVYSRGRMADELEVQTAQLRDARDERTRLEVATDRATLSRDLDELLQRRLGELARLADPQGRPTDPAAATATLAEIEHQSRRTLEQMRELVGTLRDEQSDPPTAPQPTLTHLDALLVRTKGADARLRVEGDPQILPAAVELSAFRIVEQLLAALKDVPDVDVTISFRGDALELAVSGPAGRRAKESIERARERAELHRGTLQATTRDGHTEAVALLPVLAGA